MSTVHIVPVSSQLFPSHRAFRWVGCIKSDWRFYPFRVFLLLSVHLPFQSIRSASAWREKSHRWNYPFEKMLCWWRKRVKRKKENEQEITCKRSHTATDSYAFNKTIIIIKHRVAVDVRLCVQQKAHIDLMRIFQIEQWIGNQCFCCCSTYTISESFRSDPMQRKRVCARNRESETFEWISNG